MNNVAQIIQQVLHTYGVAPCEHFLMCTVGYRILLPAAKLIQTSATLSEGDPLGEFTPAHYMEVLHACIHKKWLQIITEDLYEEEMTRRQSSNIPEILASGFVPGVIDFTEPGYFLHRQIMLDIFGSEDIDYGDSGWTIDEYHQRIDVYAPTLEICIKRMEEFKQSPSDCIGHQVGNIVADDPELIVAWKPNRFISLPHGFHAVIHYQVYNEGT